MLISKELLAQIRRLQIKTDRLASEILSGEYKSAFKGRGLNFDAIREYQIGDDIRTFDWKVTARMQAPFVRQYKEERQLTIVLIVDMSASNKFGTTEKNKLETAIEMAAVLASLAIKNNDKVGALFVTDKIEYSVPVKQGKSHIFKLIKDLMTYEPRSPKTNLKAALADATTMIPPGSVTFLISDFLPTKPDYIDDGFSLDYERELKILRQYSDLIAVSIRDPREFKLPNIGYVELFNPETGAKELLNLNKRSVRKKFHDLQNGFFERLQKRFRRLGVDFLDVKAGTSYIQSLLKLFLTRERRS